MLLPLYDVLQQKKPQKSLDAKDTNMGLWFERFFNQFNDDASEILESKKINGKLTQGNNFWLQKFKTAGDKDALQLAAKQQLSLVNALKGEYKFFNTQWHFVTGTGYPHPVENGLLWHKTYGVPYLSGAAVKGLVRAWVEQWQEFESEEERKECLFSWFGSDDKDPKKQQKTSQAGDIIFFDAFPVKQVQLKTDIMTPHYGKWYSEGNTITDVANQPEKIPADWHDPVPIPFLVVDKATSFLFSIAPRHNKVEVNLDAVMDCLIQALDWLGAGAKTATGYGGFVPHQGIHEVEKQCLSLNEQLKNMEADDLIAAFSDNSKIVKTKAVYEQKGHEWKQVISLIWQYHETMINSWANSEKANTKKACKKLIAEREPL